MAAASGVRHCPVDLFAVVVGAAWLAARTEVASVAVLCLAGLVTLLAVWIRFRGGHADELSPPPNGGPLVGPNTAGTGAQKSDD